MRARGSYTSFSISQMLSMLDKGIFPEALKRNSSSLGPVDQKRLLEGRVLVLGCGGLGGYVIEILARTGVGGLMVADGDYFEESNLNRQLFCTHETLGLNKAEVAARRIKEVAPFCDITPISSFLDKEELGSYLEGVDVVVDAIGGIDIKLDVICECRERGVGVVTGAVAGFEGLVSSITPFSRTPSNFFKGPTQEGAENVLGSPAPMVSLISSIQCFEVISYLCWGRFHLTDRVLYISLSDFTFDLLEL